MEKRKINMCPDDFAFKNLAIKQILIQFFLWRGY